MSILYNSQISGLWNSGACSFSNVLHNGEKINLVSLTI